ncbi:MAG: hypothetical protein ACK481_02750 [Candidatus Melainabacteria bacterium]
MLIVSGALIDTGGDTDGLLQDLPVVPFAVIVRIEASLWVVAVFRAVRIGMIKNVI